MTNLVNTEYGPVYAYQFPHNTVKVCHPKTGKTLGDIVGGTLDLPHYYAKTIHMANRERKECPNLTTAIEFIAEHWQVELKK